MRIEAARRTAYWLLLGVVFVWGTTFVLVKDALADVSPLLFNLLRMSLAFAALLMVNWRTLRALDRYGWGMSVVAGIFLAAGYQFQTAGLQWTTPSKSAFLTGMIVVFVPFFSLWKLLRAPGAHTPGVPQFTAAAIGFGGLALLAVPAGEPWALSSINRGDLLTIGCAVAFTLHLLTLAHASPRVPFRGLATAQIGVAAMMMLLSQPLLEPHPIFHLTPRFLFAWIIAALLATAAAFSIQSWAQGFLRATHTALILALEPVFAALTSFAVLGERLHGRALGGAGLLLAALVLAELFPSGGVQPSAHEGASLH